MANPFYRNHWNPIRHSYYPQDQIKTHSTKPKIINIPVHFVGSDDPDSKRSPVTAAASAVSTGEARVAATVTIQRAVRGFLVRKNARVVRQVAAEVDEIERKVREEEANIRLDAKERLRVGETLMALLLRLDSVRGVRDYRKRVIRRVITLQEAIDSISAAADAPISTMDIAEDREGLRDEASEESSIDHEKTTDQILNLDEEMNEDDVELGMEITAAVESSKVNNDLIATVEGRISVSSTEEDREVSRIEAAEEASIEHEKAADQTLDPDEEINEAEMELEIEIPAAVESPERQSDLIAAGDGTISSSSVSEDREGSVEAAEESSIEHVKATDQTLDLQEETNEAEAELEMKIRAAVESPKRKSDLIGIEIGEDGSRSTEAEEEIPKADEEGASTVESSAEVKAKSEEGRGMREMVERMAVENERLKGMVAQLCATSSEQCRLMEGLVNRVEHLERVVHRMDRRKKRKGTAACSALSSTK